MSDSDHSVPPLLPDANWFMRCPVEDDWTADPATGRSNSSEAFRETVRAVECLIRGEGHALIAGQADVVAGLIVAQLAHRHGFAPKPRKPTE